jgi:hypothetical protein
MRIFHQIGAIVSLVGLAFLDGGCASIIKGTTQAIPVSSDPLGAEVRLDGSMVGQTPLTLAVKRKSDHLITIEKTGYLGESTAITRTTSGAVAGNIILGALGLVGWGVDAMSGAQYNLTPETIRVNLMKTTAASPAEPVAPDRAATFIEELRRLDALHAAKSITDEEYTKMRRTRVDQYSNN